MTLLKREISIVCCNLLGLQINRQVQFKLKFTFKITHDRQFKRQKKNQFKVSLLATLVQLVDKKRLLFMIVSLKKKQE